MAATETVRLERLPITLGQLLKLLGAARTGGQAKLLLATGQVRVNGQPETRRGRKLYAGDQVELPDGTRVRVEAAGPPPPGNPDGA